MRSNPHGRASVCWPETVAVPSPMRIEFTQSGGFAGLVKGCSVDTDSLPAADADQLHAAVRTSGISGSIQSLSQGSRDRIQYQITIDDKGTRSKAEYDDGTLPEQARPLLALLRGRSAPQAP